MHFLWVRSLLFFTFVLSLVSCFDNNSHSELASNNKSDTVLKRDTSVYVSIYKLIEPTTEKEAFIEVIFCPKNNADSSYVSVFEKGKDTFFLFQKEAWAKGAVYQKNDTILIADKQNIYLTEGGIKRTYKLLQSK